ncbi:MAG TPA: tetratricopeptide repeat protein [Acidobacteriota bacterium]|nr:tetratricopeptide repeat protein [Acidobacteriota bacterium]
MNSLRTRIIIAIALALPLTLSGAAGVIKGKVTDPDGNPVKDVRITLRDTTRAKTYVFKTDKKGGYFHKGIDPSEYVMKLEKEGYLPLEGQVFIASEPEVVRNAVLAPAAEAPVKAEWEAANVEANRLYKEGRYEEALKLYQGILAGNAGLAAIQFNAGNCFIHLERYEEAVGAFKEAVRLKPDFFDAYTNLANAFGKLKKFDEALPLFEQALTIHPESPALLSSAGLLYLSSGRSDKAVEYLEKAAALDPDARHQYYSLGIAYSRQGDLAKAVDAYEKFLVLNTDPAEATRVRGIVDRLKALMKK